jgi:hypothetical protein
LSPHPLPQNPDAYAPDSRDKKDQKRRRTDEIGQTVAYARDPPRRRRGLGKNSGTPYSCVPVVCAVRDIDNEIGPGNVKKGGLWDEMQDGRLFGGAHCFSSGPTSQAYLFPDIQLVIRASTF